jgi:integrase
VPKFRKPKVAAFSRDYQWLRSDDEVRRFLFAARAEYEHVFAFYAIAIYAGMRAGELAALEWPDVDLERRLITVQRSFDGPTKSDRVRYVPILDPLLPSLRQWRLRHRHARRTSARLWIDICGRGPNWRARRATQSKQAIFVTGAVGRSGLLAPSFFRRWVGARSGGGTRG